MNLKILNNLKLNFVITFIIGIMGFIVNKYFVKYMGADMLGLMKLFTQMIAYLSLVDLGISNASAYALYKPLANKNILQINLVVSTIESFYKKISYIILILGIFLTPFIPFFIKSDSYGKEVFVYWILYIINTAIGYMFAKYSILFTANQEYDYVRKVQGIGKFIFQFLQILVLIVAQSFLIFIIIMILENIFLYYFYKKHFKKNYTYIKKVKERDKNILIDMKNLFWHKIAGVIVFNTDYIILSKFISLSIVGIYSSYLMIYQMAIVIINVLSSVITPEIGMFVAKNSKEKIYESWKRLYSIYNFLATIIIIVIYELILPFVNLWLGEGYELPKVTIILILINLFVNITRGVTDIFKQSCGFFDDLYAPILETILNVIFSIVLVQIMGLDGVIIGTIISNLIVIIFIRPIIVFKRCFDKKFYIYIKDLIFFMMLVMISIYSIDKMVKILKLNFEIISTWINLIEKGFILGSLSLLITTMVFLLDKEFRANILKIIFKIKK